jgi:pimeloyl-ACP methyl ester carboxylesterase
VSNVDIPNEVDLTGGKRGVVGRVDVPGGELAYEERGSGLPVVFVHSAGADRGMWRPTIGLLHDRYRCIAVDLFGFGDSSVPTSRFSDFRALLALCASLRLEKPILAGNSLGGLTVLNAAIIEPTVPAGLVLLAAFAGGWTYSAELVEATTKLRTIAADQGADEALEAEIDLWLYNGRDPSAIAPETRSYVRSARRNSAEKNIDHTLREPMESLSMLDRVSVPTAIAIGEHDFDDFTQIGRLLQAGIRDSTLMTVAAGHFIPLEAPDVVAEMIDDVAARATLHG